MSESQLFLEWTAEAKQKGKVEALRDCLLLLLTARFPGAVLPELREIIAKQDSLQILDDWYEAALTAFSIDTFRPHVMP